MRQLSLRPFADIVSNVGALNIRQVKHTGATSLLHCAIYMYNLNWMSF